MDYGDDTIFVGSFREFVFLFVPHHIIYTISTLYKSLYVKLSSSKSEIYTLFFTSNKYFNKLPALSSKKSTLANMCFGFLV